jgi:uncharacterized membrane protein
MRTRRHHYWMLLRSTFWFVPGLMIIAAGLLAGLALAIDASPLGLQLPDWVSAGGADGARALLSTVAGSMVTVAGLGFSITIVALVLASTQFGPRLLSLFMRDTTSQVILGTFAGTFTYCVLILRSIRGPDEGGTPFVPQLAVTLAVGLTLLSVAAVVYFFHHVAVSIQAPKVVAAVARDLDHAIDHLHPVRAGRGGPQPEPTEIPSPETDGVVRSATSGYVQVIDDEAMFEQAVRHDLRIRLMTRPGLFVVRGNPILVVWPSTKLDEVLQRRLRSTLIIGDTRTAEDDIEYSVRQLVEVALRALSPAINDPFTAMAAIDWLGAALARLARTEFPSRYRYDEQGRLRVVADVSTFGGISHTIFSRIRHYGGSSPVVLNRLLEAVAAFGPHITDESDRELVRDETEAVLRVGRALSTSDADLEELEKRYRAAVLALAGGSSSSC